MILVMACHCGGTDSLIRNFLHSAGYKNWLNIPIRKGKEASMSALNNLPPSVEKEALRNFLSTASKWAVIVGYSDNDCKWSDIAHNGAKSRIEAEVLVSTFSEG